MRHSTTFLLVTQTAELSVTMLKAPTALILVFFSRKSAGRIKNLGCTEPSWKTRTCSCRCAPTPSPPGRLSHSVHWRRGTWEALLLFSLLLLEGNLLHPLVTSPMSGSQQTFHKCLLDGRKLNGRPTFWVYDSAHTQGTSSRMLQQSALSGLHQKPTKRMQSLPPISFADREVREMPDTSRYSKLKNVKNFIQAQWSHICKFWLKGQRLYFAKLQTPEHELLLSYLQSLYILLLTLNFSLESEQSPSKIRSRYLKITNNLPPSSGSHISSHEPAPNNCTNNSTLLWPPNRNKMEGTKEAHGTSDCREDALVKVG